MDLEAMVRELWDRDRIARIPRRYSRGIDRRDWDLEIPSNRLSDW